MSDRHNVLLDDGSLDKPYILEDAEARLLLSDPRQEVRDAEMRATVVGRLEDIALPYGDLFRVYVPGVSENSRSMISKRVKIGRACVQSWADTKMQAGVPISYAYDLHYNQGERVNPITRLKVGISGEDDYFIRTSLALNFDDGQVNEVELDIGDRLRDGVPLYTQSNQPDTLLKLCQDTPLKELIDEFLHMDEYSPNDIKHKNSYLKILLSDRRPRLEIGQGLQPNTYSGNFTQIQRMLGIGVRHYFAYNPQEDRFTRTVTRAQSDCYEQYGISTRSSLSYDEVSQTLSSMLGLIPSLTERQVASA